MRIRKHPALLAAAVALLTTALAGHAATVQIADGRRIYYEGRLASGAPVEAAVNSDTTMQGDGLACVNCHRRSGYGSSESRVVIPPIIGTILFTPQRPGLQRDYRNGRLGNVGRPAYTLDTLARALREGLDAEGRPLLPMMPRYRLDDEQVAAVAAYLNTLSSQAAPGIGDEDIHFATVITPGTDKAQRMAVQEVFDHFIAGKNAGTRNEERRADHAPFQNVWMYSSYRKWVMHTWELQGPEQTWGRQLKQYSQQQPVFALLGGIGDERWRTVHEFCEAERIPCLFPHITTPPRQWPGDFYSVYFSSGLRLEAQTMIADLEGAKGKTVLQLRRDDIAGEAASEVKRLISTYRGTEVEEIVVGASSRINPRFIELMLDLKRPDILVLWLKQADSALLDEIAASPHAPQRIYLSATLFPDSTPLTSHALAPKIRLLHPYLLPDQQQKTLRFRSWARQAGITLSEPRLQADAYFAVTLAGEALSLVRNNYSREYFLERIEHMTDSMLTTSYYPRLELAPGQRYAAKGAYVWQLDQPPSSARWIVP